MPKRKLRTFIRSGSASVVGGDTISLDTTPPSVPSSLVASAISSTQIELDWVASVDSESGVQDYDVLNDTTSELVSGVTSTVYTVSNLLPNTSYSFRVRARDNSGNVSSYSSQVSATTQATGTVQYTYIIPSGNFGSAERLFDGTNLSTGFNGGPWVTSLGLTRLPQGGDIIELAAGQHIQSKLTFQRINGTADNRVVIRGPQTGAAQAVIRRLNVATGNFPLLIRNCSHMTVDGYLPTAGSFTTAPYQCGIKVTYAVNAVAGLGTANKDGPGQWIMWGGSTSAAITDATMQYVEIDGGWAYASTAADPEGHGSGYSFEGIGAKIASTAAADGTWNERIKFNSNWVHGTQGEGYYGGSNAYAGHIPMRNHEIAYNIIEDCGGGAIHQKLFLEGDNRCHHNILRRCGLNAPTPSRHAITHQLTTCRVYNNWIENSGGSSERLNAGPPGNINIYTIDSANTPAPGEKFMGLYGPYTSQNVWVYNNVILRGGNSVLMGGADPSDGISVGRVNPAKVGHTVYIYNNTILDNYGRGIDVNIADGGFIKNNIVRGNKQGEIETIAAVPASNNDTTSNVATLFVNYSGDDFRLSAPSASQAAGTLGVDISETAFGAKRTAANDPTRPIGATPDIGALEA